MTNRKDTSIEIRCTKKYKENMIKKASILNLSVSNLFINGATSYGLVNPMLLSGIKNQQLNAIKPKQICELALCLKDLRIKLPDYESEFDEITRRCEEICLN